MSEPFIAEIRMVGFNFAPRGWAFCDGQLLPINQNQPLYSLIGTIYGGDGRSTFALPDLRGRTPIHTGQSNGGPDRQEGEKDGTETQDLSIAEMPNHDHVVQASAMAANELVVDGNILATPVIGDAYRDAIGQETTLGTGTIANFGNGQGHDNMMPWIVLNFCIALQGLFPPRS